MKIRRSTKGYGLQAAAPRLAQRANLPTGGDSESRVSGDGENRLAQVMQFCEVAMVQDQWCHLGIGAPPILIYSVGIGMFTGGTGF